MIILERRLIDMGLDVSAYSNLKKIDCVYDVDGEPIDKVTNDPISVPYFRVYVNYDFPGREEGVEHKSIYSYQDYFDDIGMGYGRYNAWRNYLAKIAGYPAVPVDKYKTGNIQYKNDQGAWNADSGPFWELINFSDCKGVIGPVVSKKLAKDFADYQKIVDGLSDEYFKTQYSNFRKAFEIASNDGAVDFH
jgi:hypothetical protein